jgi:hypothetical protein
VKVVHVGITAWRENKQEVKKFQQEYQSRRWLLSDRRGAWIWAAESTERNQGKKTKTCQHNRNQQKQPGTGDFTRAAAHRAVVALAGHRLLHGKGKTR